MVERGSRFAILLHLPDGRHTADLVRDAVVEAFGRLPVAVRRSLTWDQGKEMALHAQIAGTLGMPVFFCQKASPRQRPSNENTNGVNTFRRTLTCASTPPGGSPRSPSNSTPAPAKSSAG